ncbi:hypothetical protein K1719_024237 [Acacia pycnantha]|nr:hypothetical protein K1719_024237 [Acacia pycnantha]
MADNFPSDHPTLLGQETQPCVLISRDQYEQISKNLRDQITKSIKDMKVLSREATSSEPLDAEILVPEEVNAIQDETPKRRGKRPTTKVVGEFSLSYEIPPICIQNNFEDLDKLLLCDERAREPKKRHQFSFIERLQNWTLRLRERPNGKHRDVYYNHMMSESLFRSKKEVVNFMIHEKYPKSKNTNKKEKKLRFKKEEATTAANNNDDDESLGEKKQKCEDEKIDQLAIDREMVEKFLAESYENLMNRNSDKP